VLEECKVPVPRAEKRDVVVKLHAAATNPVDGKIRRGAKQEEKKQEWRIPGYDGCGVVSSVGSDVTGYKVGDEVMFAGNISRPGSYAEYVAVDERLVGRKPRSLSWVQAASLPLVSITAWEGLIEQLGIAVPVTPDDEKRNKAKSLLVIAGAGGVGSMVSQIAKNILKIGLVVSTASRPDTVAFCKSRGADATIDHRADMSKQLAGVGAPGGFDYVFNCAETEQNWDQVMPLVGNYGKIVLITGTSRPLNVSPLFVKRATVTFEMMFTRGLTGVEPERQQALLNVVGSHVDGGRLLHSLTTTFPFTEAGVRQAATLQDSGTAIGKIGITIIP